MTEPDEDDSIVLIDGPWTHRTVRANGIAQHIAEAGSGPLVLLLHGMPTFWWTWHHQIEALAAAGFRAVAVDLRGYGASDKPPRGYDATTLASDIASLVAALGERDACIVGNDLGGQLAWTIAAQSPDLVRRIAVLGSPHPLSLRRQLLRDRAQRRASAFAMPFQWPFYGERALTRDDALLTELMDRWSGPRWRGTPDFQASVATYAQAMRIHPVAHCALEFYRWSFRSLPRKDGRAYTASMRGPVRAPVLQLQGDFDGCVLPAAAEGSGRWVAGDYRYRLLTGVGHFPQQEAPEEVSRLLVDWAGEDVASKTA